MAIANSSEAGNCSFESGWPCIQLVIGILILKDAEEQTMGYILGYLTVAAKTYPWAFSEFLPFHYGR